MSLISNCLYNLGIYCLILIWHFQWQVYLLLRIIHLCFLFIATLKMIIWIIWILKRLTFLLRIFTKRMYIRIVFIFTYWFLFFRWVNNIDTNYFLTIYVLLNIMRILDISLIFLKDPTIIKPEFSFKLHFWNFPYSLFPKILLDDFVNLESIF